VGEVVFSLADVFLVAGLGLTVGMIVRLARPDGRR
jgi:hypothetical protein